MFRVPCLYPGLTVTFHVEHGSNPYYLAVLVEYANGDGDVVQVHFFFLLICCTPFFSIKAALQFNTNVDDDDIYI